MVSVTGGPFGIAGFIRASLVSLAQVDGHKPIGDQGMADAERAQAMLEVLTPQKLSKSAGPATRPTGQDSDSSARQL